MISEAVEDYFAKYGSNRFSSQELDVVVNGLTKSLPKRCSKADNSFINYDGSHLFILLVSFLFDCPSVRFEDDDDVYEKVKERIVKRNSKKLFPEKKEELDQLFFKADYRNDNDISVQLMACSGLACEVFNSGAYSIATLFLFKSIRSFLLKLSCEKLDKIWTNNFVAEKNALGEAFLRYLSFLQCQNILKKEVAISAFQFFETFGGIIAGEAHYRLNEIK